MSTVLFVKSSDRTAEEGVSTKLYEASFAIQEAGMFDPDTGLLLMTRSKTFELEFAKDTDLSEVQAVLTKHLCS